jgi:hypothetical protein
VWIFVPVKLHSRKLGVHIDPHHLAEQAVKHPFVIVIAQEYYGVSIEADAGQSVAGTSQPSDFVGSARSWTNPWYFAWANSTRLGPLRIAASSTTGSDLRRVRVHGPCPLRSVHQSRCHGYPEYRPTHERRCARRYRR